MKRIKKIASLLLAMAMVFAMSVTAFATTVTEGEGDTAEPETSIEGEGDTAGSGTSTEGEGDTTEPETPTVTHTYEIYQIFTGDYSEGVLSNVKWGENGTGTKGQKVDKETVLDELQDVADNPSDTEQLAVIQKYANLKSKPIRTGSETEYTGLTPGYYLVKDQDGSLDKTNVPYTLYVVQVVDNTLSFTPKGDIPTPEKKIVEDDKKVTENEASIGDEVNYEITGTMPTNIADYKTYYYMFTDTLSKGLTYKENSIQVTVNGKDVTDYFYKEVGTYNETSGTTIRVGISDIKALSLLKDPKPVVGEIDANTEVVLTYTATLNENAVIAGEGNPNDVKLSYSNNPNDSGKGSTTPPENPDEPKPTHPVGESPEKEVVTYTTELTILKTNEDKAFLPGVQFTLKGEGVNIVLVTEEKFEVASDGNGEYWKLKDGTYTTTAPTIADDETDNSADYESTEIKYTKTTDVVAKGTGKTETNVVGTVQADGTVTFKGLGAGNYTITETKTLPGYNTIEPISFKLTFENGKFKSDNDKVTVGDDNMLDTSIENKKGSLLPSTGGIGTTIFYVVGSILVIGAGILLVTKRRMKAQ